MRIGGALVGLAALTAAGSIAPEPPPRANWIEPRTGMEFVSIPRGTFLMGSPPTEAHRESQESRHQVTLTRDFELGRYEVTQGQWRRVMGANPSRFAARGEEFPVERVNFHDVLEFLRRLNAGQTSRRYRLPTEAEWEYACRAGTTTAFSTGDTLSKAQANVREKDEGTGTSRVGTFPSNAWGLFDMHGNVWEWTADDFCPYPSEPSVNPRPRCTSGLKVIRGGSWYFGADSARCALRYTHPPEELGFSLGFRVAADPP